MHYLIACTRIAKRVCLHLFRTPHDPSPTNFLRRGEFQAFLLSTGFLSVSQSMAGVVYPWVVFQQTGSPAWVGIVIGVPAILSIGPTFVGGILADRISKPNLLVATRLLQMIVALLLAISVTGEEFAIWYLFGLLIIGRAIVAIGFPASSTLIAELVSEKDMNSANAARSVVAESTEIAGAGLGGVALVILGPAAAFLTIASIYGLSAISMLFVRTSDRHIDMTEPGQNSGVRLRDAFAYLRKSRILQILFVLALVDFFTVAIFPVLPAYADQKLGVSGAGFGLLMAGLSVGGVVAGLALVKYGNSMNAPKAIVIGNVGWGICMVGVERSGTLTTTLMILIIMGAFGAVTGVAWSSLVLRSMPIELRGRLFSIFNIAFQGFFLGAILSGFISSNFGLSIAMWFGAAGSIVVPTAIWAVSPAFRAASDESI